MKEYGELKQEGDGFPEFKLEVDKYSKMFVSHSNTGMDEVERKEILPKKINVERVDKGVEVGGRGEERRPGPAMMVPAGVRSHSTERFKNMSFCRARRRKFSHSAFDSGQSKFT